MEARGISDVDEFTNLMETYAVDYVFSGDYHSYFRSTVGSTDYIILGGGGAALDDEATGRSFHHAMLLTVDPETGSVNEMIYPINETLDMVDLVEQFAFFHIYTLLECYPAVYILIVITNLVILFTLTICMGSGQKKGNPIAHRRI